MSAEALPLGDVLSVTDGHLVSRDHIQGVYRVCDYMTGVANFTHQLPRVCDEIKPAIFAQHPWLADVKAPEWNFDGESAEEARAIVFAWLDDMEALHGRTVSLVPLAEYDAPNPIEEACDMVGAERVYVVDPSAPGVQEGAPE